ncbi:MULTISPECIES: tRNA (guanosine(18)-2'-O)-methyltransferase TrmH [unclassified Meiothermus]|uniref:tRNA (guanosine(18)-2'-O)-methyltransferase TrmH n=1 Tax=unclassified Meiothermus TaxID=370471 RepID=UPI000D7BA5F5|nr:MULTISPECIES: tRNA (guanosine(18)-2'-O)-methyltransferase TrmH [unclassified Meiothermus]PZA08168.1 tRNA (guanosine(18)-2'-O)-methyltransferase TrmH [Meiothermus sp. Pnk-1]RYM32679.1 tRNA (guanosine(18)-2'-O)-methyltransferase TrmH [Meiothermus sp. PNK-Is4]
MTPERWRKINAVLDRRQPDLTVLMERVHKWHNFSAVLRSCDAVGVLEAHLVPAAHGIPEDKNPSRPTAATSGSAAKWVGVRLHPDTPAAFAELRARGFIVYAAHFSPVAVDYREVDYTQPTCILLGTEKWGVTEEAAALADGHIVIPMMGMVQSLNVSVAAAVILFEAQRQRMRLGMYDGSRLEPALRQRLLFEWAYPDWAERCRKEGRDYPPLGPEGEILW